MLKFAPKEGGVIVRTAAEGASAEDIERDLVFLQRLWKTVQTRAKQADLRRAHNMSLRTEVRSAIKNVKKAVAAGNKDNAELGALAGTCRVAAGS